MKMLRLLSALWALFYCSATFAAGTVPGFSLTPQFDLLGKPAVGCKLFVIQAGTTSTPQNAYQDSGLTIPLPNPMVCDSTARLSQFFLADGQIKLRLTDKNGVQLFVGDNLLVVGPSSGGGGGGGSVDPTTILQTGDFKQIYNTGVVTGFVRCNGRTIGSATSGATERANADTQALFAFLWGADPNLAVSGGRGASAAADFAANKTIALPDCRGRVLANLSDMGNSAASWLSSTYFGASPTTLGAVSTTTDHVTLGTTNLPPYTPTVASTSVTVTSSNWIAGNSSDSTGQAVSNAGNPFGATVSIGTGFSVQKQTSTGTPSIAMNAQGGASTPFSSVQPSILVTTYIKL